MTDLISWLRAQVDTDKRLARAAEESHPHWEATTDGTVCQVGTGGSGYLVTGPWGGDLGDIGHHIANFDPARVLAEVESKRLLIDKILRYEAKIDGEWGCCHDAEDIAAGRCEETNPNEITAVRALALAYRDREGYRAEEWAP